MRSARWAFIRAYLIIAVLVLFTGLLLERLLNHFQTDAELEQRSNQLEGGFLYAQTLSGIIQSESPTLFEQRLEHALDMPSSLHPLEDFHGLGEHFDKLAQNQTVVMFDENDRAIYYRRLQDSDWVLALGPEQHGGSDTAIWVVPVFYSMLAFAVFLWIRPLSRDLNALQDAAAAFGEQDFSTRVSIPATSWLAQLGLAFNSMAQRIQSLMRKHKELTQTVSHELRTPLARIRFSLEMMETAGEIEQARHRNSIKDDVDELNLLLEEMLAYAELDQGNLIAKPEPLDLGKWLADYLNSYKSCNPDITISLHRAGSTGSAMADKRLLKRSLDNLLGNAMRYARSSIELVVEMDDSHCEIRVTDDGPGIPVSEREAAIQAYSRLPSPGQSAPGFGLGLAIVQGAMRLHHGELIIGSAELGGADMRLRWPIDAAARAEP